MSRFLTSVLSLSLVVGCSASGTPGAEAAAGGTGGDTSGGGAGGQSVTFTTSSSASGGGASTGCKHATYTGYTPGPDGVFGTGDDVVTGSDEIDFAPGKVDFYSLAHPVTQLRKDATGQPTNLLRWIYDAKGARKTITQYVPGPDGQYETADDVVNSLNAYSTDASGALEKDLFHTTPGPNGVWGDTDDVIGKSVYFVQKGGKIVWLLAGTAPGPDGVWGDADDNFILGERLEYDAKGRLAVIMGSSQAGDDAHFGTADDVFSSRTLFPCRGDRVVSESYDAGPDGTWGTADDVLVAREIETGDVCSSADCAAPVPW